MPVAKYFDAIRNAQSAAESERKPDAPFDLSELAASSRMAEIGNAISRSAFGPLYAFSRRFKPVMRLAGLIHVTREDHVRDILNRPGDFNVPFGPEMKELGGGATFMLGLDGEHHARYQTIMRQVILPQDGPMMRAKSAEFTSTLLDNHAGKIDVINDVIKRVPAEICLRYFGLNSHDADAFGDWTLAISALLFGDPFGDPTARKLALNAAAKMSAIIDDAIHRTRKHVLKPGDVVENAGTLVHRLLIVQQSEPLTDLEIRSILIGMASGFIPTNTIAASNMLTILLDRPEAKAMAIKAARGDDRDLMRKIILEAGRLNPTLAPGQWRYAPHDTHLGSGKRTYRIPGGSTVLVSTVSAMRDPRAWDKPHKFRIDRTNPDGSFQDPDMLFGVGPHSCIGRHLAEEQIAGVFTELFKRENLHPASGKTGRLSYLGIFPRHRELVYDSISSRQSMFFVLIPVTDGASLAEVETTIGALGHPAEATIRKALDATDLVHFASLAALESERGLDIIFELSTDGSADEALAAIGEKAGPLLAPMLAHTDWDPGNSIGQFLIEHKIDLHGKFWGASALCYNGLSEFPVSKVVKQQRFADFMGRVMRDFVATETARGSHPMLALQHMRKIVRQDPVLHNNATQAQRDLMDEAKREGFDAFHLATPAMRLRLASYRAAPSHFAAFMRLLASKDGPIIWMPFAAMLVLTALIAWTSLDGSLASKMLITPLVAIAGTLMTVAVLLGTFLLLLRSKEKSDVPDRTRPTVERMRTLLDSENLPGFAQNHFFGTANLKPGLFRRLLHTFSFWGNRIAITYWFRPGFILKMGTIHYARWCMIPGTSRAVFYSNFDGSWESYLEDFIARVHWGQSATWSNWQGFPDTKFLVYDGAKNSDEFKNYTRNVQRVAPFWYSRFPELTSDQIRNNGQIHIGAGLASTSTEAKEWLRCFSSMPKHENQVELDEVQGLVFRGMKKLPYSVCLAVRLPDKGEPLGEYLCWLRGKPMAIDGLLPGGADDQIKALENERVLVRVARAADLPDEFALSHALTVTYGDRPLMGEAVAQSAGAENAAEAMAHAVFLGLSAVGLAKFEESGNLEQPVDAGMPFSFRMGMRARHKLLGDPAIGSPKGNWRWHDAQIDPTAARTGSAGEADIPDGQTEAVLMLYASNPAALERMTTIHRALLANHGGRVVTQIDCAPAWQDSERIDFEHFGFRDGISQPAMKGIGRSTRGVPERDIIEPGEFIIGYRNHSGYYPKSPTLSPEADPGGALPVVIGDNWSRFTDFGEQSLYDGQRDFGRNGTFLVLRELKQDVEGFDKFARAKAAELNQGGFRDLYKIIGQCPDADWVKAKMMGRWPDGRPLIGNPVNHAPQASRDPEERENDFSFGDDDPQGLACPFASHIRRTNPRDSKQPGDTKEQVISNRHRILRRGRPYERKDAGEKGLLFASICTDIERQFEFVQQFWSNAPAFHGLDNEPDPIIGSDSECTTTGEARPRHFSIPTAIGPIRLEGLQSFVETMGGGYFFMPSKSALCWLSEKALYQPAQSNNSSPEAVQ